MAVRMIACGVFRDALSYLTLLDHHPGLHIEYLPPALHNQPGSLSKEISRQIRIARQGSDTVMCLYGQCFPAIDDFLRQEGVPRVPGAHCYEMFLGSRSFQQVIEQEAGTYFLEKELILHFNEYCLEPLELDDPEIRHLFFRPYRRLLYIRQPLDPDLLPKAQEISSFLSLPLKVMDADYSDLKSKLQKLMRGL